MRLKTQKTLKDAPNRIRLDAHARLCGHISASMLALLAATAAKADPAGWLETVRDVHPYASLSASSDSNLLRRSDELSPASDRALRLEAGFATEMKLSRQRFLMSGDIFYTDYDRFSEFDHTGGQANLVWNWVLGDRWEGKLGYSYDRRLRDFSNDLVPTKDMRDRHQLQSEARYWLTSRWRFGAGIDWTRTTFSETDLLDKDVLDYGLNVDYVSRAGNSIGFQAKYANAGFLNRGDRDYKDFSLGPKLDWQLTGKTALYAEISYKARRYDDVGDRDFAGLVGRLRATWRPTGKTTVKATLWRDISNLDDEVSSYAVIDGARLEPSWQAMPKTRIRASASFERRDFGGSQDEGLISTLGDRVDEVRIFELGVDWTPRRTITVSLSGGMEARDSNRALRNYDANYVELGVKIAF